MRLTDRITAEGQRLFQLRSFMPLVLLPALYFALLQMARFELQWGEEVEDLWLLVCVGVSSVGLLMRCLTVGFVPAGTSGRSRGTPSASTLNMLGMYSIVRNPLYLANGVMWIGVALATTSAWFAVLSVLVYWLYIERVISAEETFLAARFGDDFRRWTASTPCFLPRFSAWRAPAMRFFRAHGVTPRVFRPHGHGCSLHADRIRLRYLPGGRADGAVGGHGPPLDHFSGHHALHRADTAIHEKTSLAGRIGALSRALAIGRDLPAPCPAG